MRLNRNKNINFTSLLKKYIKNKDQSNLNDLIEDIHYSDLAEILNNVKDEDLETFFELADGKISSEVLLELSHDLIGELVTSLDEKNLKSIFSHLPTDDEITVLKTVDKVKRSELIKLLDNQQEIEELLKYDVDSAAASMTRDFVQINIEKTVYDVALMVKELGDKADLIHYAYLIDDDEKLIGIVSLRELFLVNPKEKIADVVELDEDIITINPETDREEAAHLMTKYDLIVLPVVDKDKKIQGILTVDDILDVIYEESSEDIFKQAGFAEVGNRETDYSSQLIFGSVWSVLKARFPWLFIVLIGGLMAGGIISGFEDTLESVVVLAFFIPVIMDMGGNVGTQSSTIFVRGVVLGQININKFYKHFKREVFIGILIGLSSGLLIGLSSFLWQGSFALGIITGISMFLTVLLASAIGFLIPWILIKMGLDSAAASDPLITTVKDITSLIIYFGIANFFINYI
ncbi:magnesium transporter [Natronospora cellulosivora (SeqCode)]